MSDSEAPGGCCKVPGCTRKEPLHLYRRTWTGRIYVVTAAKLEKSLGDGTARFTALHRHDVTPQMVAFLRRNEVWVRGVLDNRDEDECPKAAEKAISEAK